MASQFLSDLFEPPFKIIEDSAVMQEVIKVIKEANQLVVLVSPYNDYHINLRHPLEAAAERVRIVAICREDQKGKEGNHLEWLSNLGAEVYLVERLHAKIYYNESSAIITSMNLSESSANNSKEIGIKIKDVGKINEIRRYVNDGLIQHAQKIEAKPAAFARPPLRKEATQAPVRGFCIRGGEEIPYNPNEPLCPKHKRTWNKFKNTEFPERHCHLCGKEQESVSFAKPLCKPCWQAVN